jgi:hypothetical protein
LNDTTTGTRSVPSFKPSALDGLGVSYRPQLETNLPARGQPRGGMQRLNHPKGAIYYDVSLEIQRGGAVVDARPAW